MSKCSNPMPTTQNKQPNQTSMGDERFPEGCIGMAKRMTFHIGVQWPKKVANSMHTETDGGCEMFVYPTYVMAHLLKHKCKIVIPHSNIHQIDML